MINITVIKQLARVKLRQKAEKDLRLNPLTETPEPQLTTEPPLTKKDLNLPKKIFYHPKTKKKPQQDGRRGTSTIIIKSYTR